MGCLDYFPIMESDPAKSLSEAIDRIEEMREELLSVQRSLEKIEVNNRAESQDQDQD